MVDSTFRGAGGNRTPVHQSVNGPDTTIPTSSLTLAHWRVSCPPSGGLRIVFPNRQRSFSPSVVFPTVIPHFCCRAVMDWPRAALLLTMTLVSPENQAARVNCSLAILLVAPFNESEQLGSQTRPSDLTSKPVSPVNGMYVSTRIVGPTEKPEWVPPARNPPGLPCDRWDSRRSDCGFRPSSARC
jgi:hypothetical protein